MNIIELAREAGFTPSRQEPLFTEMLERLAALVRAQAIEECAELMDGYDYARLAAEIRQLKEAK